MIRIGIEGSNLGSGGAVTHLCALLGEADPVRDGFSSVLLWGREEVLEEVADRPWLQKATPPALSGGMLRRSLWQKRELPALTRTALLDVLFVPGGSFSPDRIP